MARTLHGDVAAQLDAVIVQLGHALKVAEIDMANRAQGSTSPFAHRDTIGRYVLLDALAAYATALAARAALPPSPLTPQPIGRAEPNPCPACGGRFGGHAAGCSE